MKSCWAETQERKDQGVNQFWGGTAGGPWFASRMRLGTPVGCTLGEMVPQRKDRPPPRDKDPAVNHHSFWLDQAIRGPWILSHQGEARASLLWKRVASLEF